MGGKVFAYIDRLEWTFKMSRQGRLDFLLLSSPAGFGGGGGAAGGALPERQTAPLSIADTNISGQFSIWGQVYVFLRLGLKVQNIKLRLL